jgi:hypothetical protein
MRPPVLHARIGELEETLVLAHNAFHPDPHGTASPTRDLCVLY